MPRPRSRSRALEITVNSNAVSTDGSGGHELCRRAVDYFLETLKTIRVSVATTEPASADCFFTVQFARRITTVSFGSSDPNSILVKPSLRSSSSATAAFFPTRFGISTFAGGGEGLGDWRVLGDDGAHDGVSVAVPASAAGLVDAFGSLLLRMSAIPPTPQQPSATTPTTIAMIARVLRPFLGVAESGGE